MHYECRYCDTGFPTAYEGDVVCASCGAEWEAAKILAEDDEE